MTDAIRDRLLPIVGVNAARRGADGVLRLLPPTTEAVAGVVGVAHDAGWRVAIEGGGTWRSELPPADLVLSLRALDELSAEPERDGCLRCGAGVALESARREALEHGSWLPLDAPGRPDRTVGSLVATGTAGPLRLRFGGVRDAVADLTTVAGDGRVHRLGADAPESIRMHVGAFGGFGVVTGCTLRVAQLPRADITWVATADRDRLTATARVLTTRGTDAAAIELFSPALATDGEWLLAVRLMGTRDAVHTSARVLHDADDLSWHELPPERHVVLWNGTARAVTTVPLTFRLGVLAEGVDEAIDLVIARVGEGLLSASPAGGGLRWSGDASAAALRELRAECAGREIPLTLERAPWAIARAVGHLGAYREGGGHPLSGLRDLHDPHRVFVTPLAPDGLP